ncbi:5'-methylthioadenosine/adenosylhomocysteine nucleosidase [Helicobacter heilmannii]|uniref:adenosylhomocysteine nucleosidase n=2 Tax=Helicobacter heilmannii TaxID=35817 RepID=A0A0K2XY56_HELHE|nr:5'-methylthioadenosine/adenosylhomocysteine nucleosidase [Helicobacter heilmannii]CRF47880.1 Menaquinone via 6-amino-6-deoxyfutalosine step 2 [Helicobacter heilmannii]CRF49313.1 Menaquinone via 6-amino-6-deoxyfutalosine step 2 [Helicobacter heilmannii]CRF51583.1 Menaquinone via 6-amino-6-deoxyfutalosine step 2 [Helicobacter heilmannii]CRI33621.1 Menaquinone via 6-amino-6-deoxyfutalosine step 2 [Helicobacter heilmannii]BDQ27842.1 aminodeoxyfutalosine nucleosidase [Helicobacter heilmannii]
MPTFQTIGVMGAMAEEIAPILKKFPTHTSENIGNNTYYHLQLEGLNIVLAYSKIGKVHAATTASTLILHHKVQALIFSGVAGGLAPNLAINDLLLATKLCQADIDLTSFNHPLGFIPESSVFVESDPQLNALAKSVAQNLNLPLKEGIIATCDQFVSDLKRKQTFVQHFGASVVEMEGASLGFVCRDFNIPFCVLRSVSDTADGTAPADFDAFLHQSAQISADFVYAMLWALAQN